MKKSIYLLLFLHLVVFVISCDPTSDDLAANNDPQRSESCSSGQIVHNGCKAFYTRTLAERVQLTVTSNNKLKVKHIDAILHCDAERITFDCIAKQGLILISEKAETTAPHCTCPYDLEYAIKLPAYGNYKLIINDVDFGEFELNANTNVALNAQLPPPTANDF